MILEAGALANGHFSRIGSLTIKSKGVQDMASDADAVIEIFIRDRLAANFPDDAFFGEETGPVAIGDRRGVWLVDPIDGTTDVTGSLDLSALAKQSTVLPDYTNNPKVPTLEEVRDVFARSH